jgi:hypothetical protein
LLQLASDKHRTVATGDPTPAKRLAISGVTHITLSLHLCDHVSDSVSGKTTQQLGRQFFDTVFATRQQTDGGGKAFGFATLIATALTASFNVYASAIVSVIASRPPSSAEEVIIALV